MIHNARIGTYSPHNGLSPNVLNVPAFWHGYPGIASSDNVATKTQRTQGSSIAAGTAIDYPRNLQVVITPTQSSAGISAGGKITVFGRDVYGSTISESFGTSAASNASGVSGAINFAKVDTISMLLSFHSDTSSAASAYAVLVGRGNKIGLPVSIRSTDAVFFVALGTSVKSTYSGATSSDNAWTVSTGDYFRNGVCAVASSASHLQIGYLNLGFRAPMSPVE
jgi:hypothetical protein